MLFLTLAQVLVIHERVMNQSGGQQGLRDLGALQSAIAQPQMTFGNEDLYPTLEAKAAAIGHAIIQNHPFVDGNKRTGHAAMEIFLVLNGVEINSPVDEQEKIILAVAAGKMARDEFIEWVTQNVQSTN